MAAHLLTLPLELREMIYEALFSSFTVSHGFGRRTDDHRTALLRTCRQINQEAWRFLPLNIKFHFFGTESMLETLLDANQSVITRIRHIRIKAFPFPLYATGRADYYPTYFFHNALALLPGLNLERLVVEDSFHGHGLVEGWRDVVTYFDIEGLIKCDGWKELEYITPNPDFITSGYDHRRKRVAQPENWDSLLKERDGDTSGAEVRMFITVVPKPSEGAKGKQIPRPWAARPGQEVAENWRLSTPEQELKGEVSIVARRGRRAHYVQTGLSENMSWRDLKYRERGFIRKDWQPYSNDMADAVSWVYGGWGRRMHLADRALNS
ncbi:hypothetical protein BU24DRAFT_416222 [Aaosphaeria arxii CBS 175.79]|uniref:F-box domain-containing protein n=1 Tax=Aaosphaeria arxii CBS 175.79 TaxID=1450172 RepID=A0A6A5Y689_9PLEO|nr:uncharacterized protein BU24DRAFT_416222 [Aaosphaeria arxii CBS 175.79]KAF2020547.1 hypothetical protein BU24DRAFT_416222 [Aaosphaeria arxii CBS 175.79]